MPLVLVLEKNKKKMKTKEKSLEQKAGSFDIPIDHGWAWMVLLGTFGICMLVIGGIKSFGVLLVEFTREYNASQSVLTLVQSLAGFFFLGLGPLANALSVKYSFRFVVMSGGVLASVGLIMTSFAKSISVVFITYGIITGVGFGFSFSPCMVILAHHFKKRRALALGIGMSGSGVGSMLLPFLNRFLIDQYSLQGCMMVIGGIMGNIIVLGALFRPFSKYPKKCLDMHEMADVPFLKVDENGDCIVYLDTENCDLVDRSNFNEKVKENHLLNDKNSESKKFLPIVVAEKENSFGTKDIEKRHSCHIPQYLASKTEEHVSANGSLTRLESEQPLYASLGALAAVSCQNIPDLTESEEVLNAKNRNDNKMKSRSLCFSLLSHVEWSLLKNSLFMLYFVFIILVNIGYHTIFNVVPSFAEEIGLSDVKGALIVTFFGVVDLGGRIFFGWIADIFIDKRQVFYLICILLAGLGILFIPQFTTFASIVGWTLSFGMFTGGYNGLTMTIIVDSIGIQHLSSAWGFVCFAASIAMLSTPVLVGFIRDQSGSWANAFRVSGSLGTLGFLFVLIEYFLERSQRKTKQSCHSDDQSE